VVLPGRVRRRARRARAREHPAAGDAAGGVLDPPKPAAGDGGELDVRAAVLSGAVIGLLGSRLTGRLSEAALIKAIAVVLLIAAAGCIVQALT
jgi:hypothetical protein